MTRKGQWQSRVKTPLYELFHNSGVYHSGFVKLASEWVCPYSYLCMQAAGEIKQCVHLILQEKTTAKIHYPLPSMVSTELNWFVPPGASVQYAATFLACGKWSDSERWLTWFCLCLLMLQTGLSQDLICWRLCYICNTILIAGNLGYLVHPYESLYCAEQGHFPFCLCLLFI